MLLKSLLLAVSLATLAAGSACAGDNDLSLSGLVTGATQGVSKGLGQTNGQPQYTVQLQAGYKSWYSGARAYNVATSDGADLEHHYYVGRKGKLGSFDYNVAVVLKHLDGTPIGYDDDTIEYDASLSRKLAGTNYRLRLIYDTDGFGTSRTQTWLELGASRAITPKLTLSGSLANRANENAVGVTKDYMAWNLGAAYALTQSTGLDLRLYDTNQHDRGARYDNRLILSLTQKF